MEAQALPTNDARVVVTFLRKLFARFGTPKALISDRGTHFCNSQIEKALKLYGIDVSASIRIFNKFFFAQYRVLKWFSPKLKHTHKKASVPRHGCKIALIRTEYQSMDTGV